jgi:glycolate dehydrogenase FAD-binding subunit
MTSDNLSSTIGSIIGHEQVVERPDIVIDGLSPGLLAKPGSAEEVAECLKACSKENAAVVPAGLASWIECGNPLQRADVVLSLERLNRIIDYSPPDLTAVVGAGLRLEDFNDATTSERQWLPLDPAGARTSTLGAIAACGASGPLRLGFGTPRDYVIGLRLAHADGTESKSGGRVVKNVAGYDMNKLYVGSFGTLAVLTELIFKLRPLPEASATLIVVSKENTGGIEMAARVINSELQPASIFLTEGLSFDATEAHAVGRLLAIRFIDNEAAVNHQLGRVADMPGDVEEISLLGEAEAETFWKRVADLDQLAGVAVKISVPVSRAPAYFDSLVSQAGCVATADVGTGIIRLAFDSDEEQAIEVIKRMRAEAIAAGGTLFIERAAPSVRLRADAWGEIGPTGRLMRDIKERFDPASLLNPGRFLKF